MLDFRLTCIRRVSDKYALWLYLLPSIYARYAHNPVYWWPSTQKFIDIAFGQRDTLTWPGEDNMSRSAWEAEQETKLVCKAAGSSCNGKQT